MKRHDVFLICWIVYTIPFMSSPFSGLLGFLSAYFDTRYYMLGLVCLLPFAHKAIRSREEEKKLSMSEVIE